MVTHCAVWKEKVAPVVVHRGEHGEEEGEQQHHDEDDDNHARVQGNLNKDLSCKGFNLSLNQGIGTWTQA